MIWNQSEFLREVGRQMVELAALRRRLLAGEDVEETLTRIENSQSCLMRKLVEHFGNEVQPSETDACSETAKESAPADEEPVGAEQETSSAADVRSVDAHSEHTAPKHASPAGRQSPTSRGDPRRAPWLPDGMPQIVDSPASREALERVVSHFLRASRALGEEFQRQGIDAYECSVSFGSDPVVRESATPVESSQLTEEDWESCLEEHAAGLAGIEGIENSDACELNPCEPCTGENREDEGAVDATVVSARCRVCSNLLISSALAGEKVLLENGRWYHAACHASMHAHTSFASASEHFTAAEPETKSAETPTEAAASKELAEEGGFFWQPAALN